MPTSVHARKTYEVLDTVALDTFALGRIVVHCKLGSHWVRDID